MYVGAKASASFDILHADELALSFEVRIEVSVHVLTSVSERLCSRWVAEELLDCALEQTFGEEAFTVNDLCRSLAFPFRLSVSGRHAFGLNSYTHWHFDSGNSNIGLGLRWYFSDG